jgi:hypothetical protein
MVVIVRIASDSAEGSAVEKGEGWIDETLDGSPKALITACARSVSKCGGRSRSLTSRCRRRRSWCSRPFPFPGGMANHGRPDSNDSCHIDKGPSGGGTCFFLNTFPPDASNDHDFRAPSSRTGRKIDVRLCMRLKIVASTNRQPLPVRRRFQRDDLVRSIEGPLRKGSTFPIARSLTAWATSLRSTVAGSTAGWNSPNIRRAKNQRISSFLFL